MTRLDASRVEAGGGELSGSGEGREEEGGEDYLDLV